MKSLICYLVCFIAAIHTMAQKTQYFEFSYPGKNSKYAVFDSIEFVDNRFNQDHIGITEKNNRFIPIWLHKKLPDEFKALFDSATKNIPHQPYTILINFRSFFINETKGLFEFNIECYAKWDDGYWLVHHIDSVYMVKGGNIKNKLSKKTQEVVNDFVAKIVQIDLSKRKTVKPVTYDYISDIDNSEKMQLPVFNVRKPEKGVYYSYEEFKNNKPGLTDFDFSKRRDQLSEVFKTDPGHKMNKPIPRDSVYAVYDGETLWIAAAHEYARLNKRGRNFFFRTIGYESNRSDEIALAWYLFGLAGGIIVSIPHGVMFEFKINHINGKFILLRKADD
jgi:hypothetical protein